MTEYETKGREIEFRDIRAAASLMVALRSFPQSSAYEAEISELIREDTMSPTSRYIVGLLRRMGLHMDAALREARPGDEYVIEVTRQDRVTP